MSGMLIKVVFFPFVALASISPLFCVDPKHWAAAEPQLLGQLI